jgi:hypothetical protein
MSDAPPTGPETGTSSVSLLQPLLFFFATALAGWVVHTTHQQDLAIIRLEAAVAQLTRASWTRTDQRLWVTNVKVSNPTLMLPDMAETFQPQDR